MAFSDLAGLVAGAQRLLAAVESPSVPGGIGPQLATIQAQAPAAIAWLSSHLPRYILGTLDGDGTAFEFDLSDTDVLTSDSPWDPSTSTIQEIEYPTGERPRRIIARSAYEIIGESTLHLCSLTPDVGAANIRLWFNVPHLADATTIANAQMQEAAENLLAALCAGLQASATGYSVSSTVQGDAVDYRGQSPNWRAIEKGFIERASRLASRDLEVSGWAGPGRRSI